MPPIEGIAGIAVTFCLRAQLYMTESSEPIQDEKDKQGHVERSRASQLEDMRQLRKEMEKQRGEQARRKQLQMDLEISACWQVCMSCWCLHSQSVLLPVSRATLHAE